MLNQRTVRRHSQIRRGAVMVEFALTFPILVILLFGCYEVSRANMLQHAADAAAYEAARAGIIPGATPDRCRQAASFVLRATGVREFTLVITPNTIGRTTPEVSVEVTIPLRENTVMASFFFGRTTTFVGRCELTREVF